MTQIKQKAYMNQLYIRRVNSEAIKVSLDFKSNSFKSKIVQIIEKQLKIPQKYQILMIHGKQVQIDDFILNHKLQKIKIVHLIDRRNLTKSQNQQINITIKKLDRSSDNFNIPGNLPVVEILKQFCHLKGYALRENSLIYTGIGLRNSSNLFSSKVQNGSVINLVNQLSLPTHCQKAELLIEKIVSLGDVDTVKKGTVKKIKSLDNQDQVTKRLFQQNQGLNNLLQTLKCIVNPDKKLQEVQCKYVAALSQGSYDGRTEMSSEILPDKYAQLSGRQLSHFDVNDSALKYQASYQDPIRSKSQNSSQIFILQIDDQLVIKRSSNSFQQGQLQQHLGSMSQDSDISFSNLYSKFSKFQNDQVQQKQILIKDIIIQKPKQNSRQNVIKYTDSVQQNEVPRSVVERCQEMHPKFFSSSISSQDSNIVWKQEAHGQFRQSEDFSNLFKESNNDIQQLMGQAIQQLQQSSQQQIKFQKRGKISEVDTTNK